MGRNHSVGRPVQDEVELAEHIKLLTGSGMVNCNHLLTPNNSGAARWKGIHVPLEQGNILFIFLLLLKFLHRLQRAQERCGNYEPKRRSSTWEVPSPAPPWLCCGFTFLPAGRSSAVWERSRRSFPWSRLAACTSLPSCVRGGASAQPSENVQGQALPVLRRQQPLPLEHTLLQFCFQLLVCLPQVLSLQTTFLFGCKAQPE